MKNVVFVLSLLFLSHFVFAQKEKTDIQRINNKNKPERQEWLRDLGFGIFVHWGVDSQLGTVISHSMVGASTDYSNRYINDLPKTLDPYQYDGYRMAVQAKLAGAKYMVFTTKHHSGFCMWDTKTTDFKITNTPYGKDLLKSYVEGVRKAGLAVGFYYSPEDFKFLYDNDITVQRGDVVLDEQTQIKYDNLIREQTNELFSNYGKIDVLFIDGEEYKEVCKEEAWRLQPDLVITRGAIVSPEQKLPGIASNTLWESCITMGTQWQYKPTHDQLKTATHLIEILVETRAKGGNLLLNVGPHPDGYIADPEARRLTEMAAWNFVNQEAIVNVRPWILTNEDNIWFTTANNMQTVYATITGLSDWARCERKEFVLKSIKATPTTKVSILGQSGAVCEYQNNLDAQTTFQQKEDGLHISVVRAHRIHNDSKWPNPISVKLENVLPALDPPVVKTENIEKTGDKMVLKGKLLKRSENGQLKVGFEYRITEGFIGNLDNTTWKSTDMVDIKGDNDFQTEVKIIPGKTYEYRAVIVHPKITIKGDILRVR